VASFSSAQWRMGGGVADPEQVSEPERAVKAYVASYLAGRNVILTAADWAD
jgi:hypothetical protein